jgi:hypothetical protein
MAIRRISCTDQRIRTACSSERAAAFFKRYGVGVLTDDGCHGEGEHDQRDMPVPAMPRARLVVIEPEFVLGRLEAIFNGPAMAFDRYQFLYGRALGTPSGEEGQIAIGYVAADQQTSCPLSRKSAAIFSGIEIGQFDMGPIVPARAFGAFARR